MPIMKTEVYISSQKENSDSDFESKYSILHIRLINLHRFCSNGRKRCTAVERAIDEMEKVHFRGKNSS